MMLMLNLAKKHKTRRTEATPLLLGVLMTALTFSLVALLTGCGKEEYVKQEFTENYAAAGQRYLPAKVDIVMVPDNSGSISYGFDVVQNQLYTFINELYSKDWDYHFMRSYMIKPAAISKVLVNPNYNGPTLPDGTPNPDPKIVPAANAVTTVNAMMPLLGSLDTSTGSQDDTYSNTFSKLLEAKNAGKNYIRNGAILAIIVLTNGSEFSVDPFHDGTISSSNLSYWANKFKSLKNNTKELVRFYSIAADQWYSGNSGNSCLVDGGKAFVGWSYSKMVTDNYLPGKSYNFCNSGTLSSVLADISADLQIVQQSLIYSYIVLPKKPLESSIHVYRNGQEIPKNNLNGWSYECKEPGEPGYTAAYSCPREVYTVSGIDQGNGVVQPFSAQPQSGYIIKLNGTAVMKGSDTPSVVYSKP